MLVATGPSAPSHVKRLVAWRRVRFTLLASLPFGLLIALGSTTSALTWIARTLTVGVCAMLAYGWFERSPQRLPAWLARWALQLLAIVIAVPIGALLAYWITPGPFRFWHEPARVIGFAQLCIAGIFFAPGFALGAMVSQRDALAREQALAFQLDRSELERQALDARLRLLQSQVQPHFLFNTLANVRALVAQGSPRASAVLDSLVAYLRAAVPRLDESMTTVEDEMQLVRAYLELMHMRIPDRLQFTLHVADEASRVRCPPLTLLTLVENAVRHGIDPSEDGGRIEVSVTVHDGRCSARVVDTGVGLPEAGPGSGTGLSVLRERLQLAFAGDARVDLAPMVPRGACARVEFPARSGPRGTP